MEAKDYLAQRIQRVNHTLANLLPSDADEPKRLHQAMRYAVLNGGKRLRPLLVYAAGEVCGASLTDLDHAACAVELIHAYSLVHDDLPAMDNDDLRRGQPTCHKAFDETIAILAGDALQTLAFEILSNNRDTTLNLDQQLKMVTTLAKASGSLGMAGGQALEFSWTQQKIDVAQQEKIHHLKTGALITASIQLGAIAGKIDLSQFNTLTQFGHTLGLAFQIQDDIQDHATEKTNLSYLGQMSLDEASEKLKELFTQANYFISQLGDTAFPLQLVTQYALIGRSSLSKNESSQ